MSDSTNAERPGYSMSERTVGKSFENIFVNTRCRILVATFASNIHRIQQVVDAAIKYDRKVAICGRSMLNVCRKALELGYLTIPEGILIDIKHIRTINPIDLLLFQRKPGSPCLPFQNGIGRTQANRNNRRRSCGDIRFSIPGNENNGCNK